MVIVPPPPPPPARAVTTRLWPTVRSMAAPNDVVEKARTEPVPTVATVAKASANRRNIFIESLSQRWSPPDASVRLVRPPPTTSPSLARDYACADGNPRSGRCQDNPARSEEHTSELQSHSDLVCRLLLEKKKQNKKQS